MKTAIQFLTFCSLLILISCQEDDQQANLSEVDQYIARLQSGDYDAIELPPFTPETIPDLLQYSGERKLITQFPRNPISSAYSPDCPLGMYVLWTIESIRLNYIQADSKMPGRFPSLNPSLARQGAEGLEWVATASAQKEVADAYVAWWALSQTMSIYDLMQINPLEDTGYAWH